METKIIIIATTIYSKALLLKSRLESEGIDAYLANVNLIQSDVASGVKVLVKDSDAKHALSIIKELDIDAEKEEQKNLQKIENFNTIICPVDFSEDSLNAAHYAILLASKIQAEVKFVYAYNSTQIMANPFPDAFSYQIGMGNIFKDENLSAKKGMTLFRTKVLGFIKTQGLTEVKITTKVLNLDPMMAIPQYCNKFKSGLVVMGTKGIGKSKGFQAGSMALHTIENVSIPVLVVPKQYKFKALQTFNIMYLTDFDDKDFKAFRKLMSIVSLFDATVHCIHIQHEKDRISQVMLDELVDHLKNAYPDFKVDCSLIESHEMTKSINGYVSAKGINLISLSEHKRNFLLSLFSKSVVKEILFEVKTPILVFKI